MPDQETGHRGERTRPRNDAGTGAEVPLALVYGEAGVLEVSSQFEKTCVWPHRLQGCFHNETSWIESAQGQVCLSVWGAACAMSAAGGRGCLCARASTECVLFADTVVQPLVLLLRVTTDRPCAHTQTPHICKRQDVLALQLAQLQAAEDEGRAEI